MTEERLHKVLARAGVASRRKAEELIREGRRTIYDLIAPKHRRALVTVGRLDYDSEGLIILTDDGEFAQHLSHPKFGCRKTYAVKVKGRPAGQAIDRLRHGIVIDGRKTAPATIEPIRKARSGREVTNSWWRVELVEGRKRQIREMFHRVGHPVQRLTRIAIGGLEDPQLPKGSYRVLEREEISRLWPDRPAASESPTRGRHKG